MKNIGILLLTVLNFSCVSQNLNFPNQHFRLVSNIDLESASKEELHNAWEKSNSYLLLDEEKGDFTGAFLGESFSGSFEFGKLTSGFTKGISIRVELGFFQSGAFESSIAETQKNLLIQASSLYFHNDQLMNPNWNFLEIKSTDGKKLTYLRKKEIGEKE